MGGIDVEVKVKVEVEVEVYTSESFVPHFHTARVGVFAKGVYKVSG